MKKHWIALALLAYFNQSTLSAAEYNLLNVSYDPTRELYKDIDAQFAKQYQQKTGHIVHTQTTHGGSGKQARSVIDGVEADIVTLALAYDIDAISEKGKLLPQNWQSRLPNNSSPYTSTIVFLVKKGNPKGIKNWEDLTKAGVGVITPNPKTSGGARWNYLAAYGYALDKYKGDQTKAQAFVKALYKNVLVLDSGARGSTTTFVERGIGDVLIAWENEALLAVNELGKDKYEIITPSVSILAEPPVALVDKNADRHGTRKVAQDYLNYLYTKDAQKIALKHYFRPIAKELNEDVKKSFPQVKLFTINQVFGGWTKAQKEHFSDGGTFDRIYNPNSRH